MRKPQVVPDEDHEVMYERVAAVDVAKASRVVCLRTPDPERPAGSSTGSGQCAGDPGADR